MPLFASSPILTGAAPVTRKADSVVITYGGLPQAMTLYADFVECGGVFVVNSSILAVSYGATPQLIIQSNGTNYQVAYSNTVTGGSVYVSSSLAVAPAIGQRCELVATMTAAGIVQIQQSISGGAISTAAPSAAAVLRPSWGGANLSLGGGGNGVLAVKGGVAMLNALIEAGVQSFATMRALAGTQ